MYYDGQIHIEEEDQCYSCEYFQKGVTCPLLEALGCGIAQLNSDVLVKNCGFYVKFQRHLHIVDDVVPDNVNGVQQLNAFPLQDDLNNTEVPPLLNIDQKPTNSDESLNEHNKKCQGS
ncbi:MAG: hypothetical protein AAGI66_03400 [Cyanobacteria bacterium P01_H01_bin.74]